MQRRPLGRRFLCLSPPLCGNSCTVNLVFLHGPAAAGKYTVAVELAALTDPKYKGRIAIYDYYLPVIGIAAMAIGKKTAELTEADLPAIKEELLKMKANAKAVTDVVASQTALATGEADILVGGGEWVTAGIAKENPDLDFSIPKEGAILWSQSLSTKASATSTARFSAISASNQPRFTSSPRTGTRRRCARQRAPRTPA